MEKKHVIVLGGGVGGLTAAHELVERGFRVTVYEKRQRFGGKARSMPVIKTATPGKHDLPGEHGFHFVPGFYRHLPNTMGRIPYGTQTVLENLATATMFAFAREGKPVAEFPTHLPQTLIQLVKLLLLISRNDSGLTFSDMALFTRKLMVLLTSCESRRFSTWENTTWWTFSEAAQRSPDYQKYLGSGITRSLVAMKAEVCSTRTVGYILLQLLLSMVRPGESLDRMLDGPTSDVWIDPWVAYLRERGVICHTGTSLQQLHIQGDRIAGATLVQDGAPFVVRADYFVAALPVEVFRTFVTPDMERVAPRLAQLKDLNTEWMNGIQLYLDRDVPDVHGHVIYIDSPWSLTSVSQHQFWRDVDLCQYANGEVKGIISLDISDWDSPGILYKKPARACTREEIKNEVIAQIKHHLGSEGQSRFHAARVLYWHLDPDIVFTPSADPTNMEPLLVNTVGSWNDRPDSNTGIANFFLAADYVRTYTDLATMEGANEAGRRAVNSILDACGSTAPRCEVWPLREPWVFAPFRMLDWLMWGLGLPNLLDWPKAKAKKFDGKISSSKPCMNHGTSYVQGEWHAAPLGDFSSYYMRIEAPPISNIC